jgi:hypothetical protein
MEGYCSTGQSPQKKKNKKKKKKRKKKKKKKKGKWKDLVRQAKPHSRL